MLKAIRQRLIGVSAAVWLLAALTALACGAFAVWEYGSADNTAAAASDTPAISHPDNVRNKQAQASLAGIEDALRRYPPAPRLSEGRRTALIRLDAVLQEEDAAQLPAVQRYFHQSIDAAVQDMHRSTISYGAKVWHIYNHGFVVRTAAATLCFDLVHPRYLPGFALPRESMWKIVEACDVLFVSHVHADHADRLVAQSFIDKGKPVVAPEQIGYPKLLDFQVIRFEPSTTEVRTLPIRKGQANLKLVVFPGHQGRDIDNNVVLVTTPDGISVAHTGDQWDHVVDFEWIDHVAKRFRIDILLPNDWTYDIARLIRGFQPSLVIPGHANELGHPIKKRQTYWHSYERKRGADSFGGAAGAGYTEPMVVLTWGESYHYESRVAGHARKTDQ